MAAPGLARAGSGSTVYAPAGLVPGPFSSPVSGQFGDAIPHSMYLYDAAGNLLQVATLWAKHQDFGGGTDRLALGIDVPALNAAATHTVTVYFDNNNDGLFEPNEDALTLTQTPSGSVTYSDMHQVDASLALAPDPVDADIGAGAEITGTGSFFYAFSHRLCTGDTYDMCVPAGQTVGFAITVTGSDGLYLSSVRDGVLQHENLWDNLLAGNLPTYVNGGAVAGSGIVGTTATITDFGNWSAVPPPGYSVQWQRCGGANCTNISGATSVTYAITAADVGFAVRAVIHASNAFGTSAALALSVNGGLPVPAPAHNGVIYFERAYAPSGPYPTDQIWSMDGEGNAQHQVGLVTAATNSGIAVAPDGHTIAYSDGFHILIQDGSAVHTLALPYGGGSTFTSPAWSHDGQWIAFSRSGDVGIVHPDGTGLRFLGANGEDTQSTISWSPDDSKLVYSTANSHTLMVVRVDTGLTQSIGPGGYPSWGPAGQIAYSAPEGSQWRLHVYDPSTGSNRVFGSNASDTMDAWSPDGTTLLFSSDRIDPAGASVPPVFSHRGLWTLPADGSTTTATELHSVVGGTWDMLAAWGSQATYTAASAQRPPIPDGRVLGDYPGATPISLNLNSGTATMYTTRVASRLYMAFVVPDTSTTGGALEVQFDSNRDGVFDAGDAVVGLDANGTTHDGLFDGVSVVPDAVNEVHGAFGWDAPGSATYELSLPLCGANPGDMCLSAGDTAPFEVNYVGGDTLATTHAPAADPAAVDLYALLRIPPWQDLQGPDLVMTRPNDGALLQGTLTLQGRFADLSGVESASVLVDGTKIGDAVPSAGTFYLPYDASALADGLHTITWDAADGAGNHASYPTTVFVANHAPDVALTTPHANDQLMGDAALTAHITSVVVPPQVKQVHVSPFAGDTDTFHTPLAPDDGPAGRDSGIVVSDGYAVTITATGSVNCGVEGCDVGPGGRAIAGGSAALAPTAPHMGLLARIGTSGPWTFVGAGPTTFSRVGELYFAVNDGLFTDNGGPGFDVTVSTPSPLDPLTTFEYSSDGGDTWSPIGGADGAAPSTTWSTGALPDGNYLVRATSYNAAGVTSSAAVPVEIANALANLKMELPQDISLDPAIAYDTASWQVERSTVSTLLTYPDSSAPRGGRLEPELAREVPTVDNGGISADGLTYTFHLRSDFAFADGSPVTAANVLWEFKRELAPGNNGPGRAFMQDLVGASAFENGQTVEIAGITVPDDYTIQFQLTQPDADFLSRVSMPFFGAVPTSTPVAIQTAPVMTSGPYSITSYIAPSAVPGQVVLTRNPHYAGSRGRTFAQITIATGVQPDQMIADVKNGVADYSSGFGSAAATLLRYGFETGTAASPGCTQQAGTSPASYSSDAIAGGAFGETNTGCDSGWMPGAFSQMGWGTPGWYDFFTFTVLKPVRVDSVTLSGWENAGSWAGQPGFSLEITPKDGPLPSWLSPTTQWTQFGVLSLPNGGATFTNRSVAGPGVLQPGTYAIRFHELSTPDPWTAQLSLTSVKVNGAALDGSSSVGSLNQEYGPGSPAAAAGKQRFFQPDLGGINYLALNTARGPFSDSTPVGLTTRGALLRQAVAYAIDRTALANAAVGQGQTPADQIIPPGIPGFVDDHVHSLAGPDLAQAKALIAEAGGAPATPIRIWGNNGSVSIARTAIVKANLEAAGFTVVTDNSRSAGQLIGDEGTRSIATGTNGYDIAFLGWINDYADPFDDLDVLLNGRNATNETNNQNISYFNDPTINAQLDAAAQLSGQARLDAYSALDLTLSRDYAPIVPYSTFASTDFFSERIGCQLSPFGIAIDLGALCDRNHLVAPTGVTVDASSDALVRAGAANVDINQIPLAVFDPAVAQILGVPTTPPAPGGADVHAAPVNSLPVNSLPVNSLPVNSLPVNSLPVNSLPVNSLPVNSLPVNSLPVNSLPIDYPGGWPAVLAGTALANVPLQTVTLPQVFALSPPPAALDPASGRPQLTLGELDLSHSDLGRVPFDMLMLGGTTVDTLRFTTDQLSVLQAWCDANPHACPSLGSKTLMGLSIEGAPVNSLPVNSLPVNSLPVNSLPVNSLPVNSLPTSASPVNSLPVNSLDLAVSPIGGLSLQEIVRHSAAIGALPVNSLPVNSLPVNSLPATATLHDAVELIPPTLTVRDVAAALSPFTLGDLGYYGDITIGQLVQGLPPGITYGDILAILLPRAALPWENVRATDFGAYEPTTTRPREGMSAGFVLEGAGVGPATVTVTLPDGFQYVAGSAHLTHEGLDEGGAGEPQQNGQNLTWSFGGVTYGDSYAVDFSAFAGTTIGATQFKEQVAGTRATGTGTAGFDVGDTLEPNDTPALAPVVTPDTTVQVSYISHSGDVDYYRVHMPATKGTRVLVHLANLPADFDLALYSDHAADVKPTTTPGVPLQDPTIPDQGVSLNGQNGQLTPASLQDVPDPGLQLLQVSANRGTDDEDVSLISNGSGDAVIAVFGYNGASSPSPYTLRVTTQTPQVQMCPARTFDFGGQGATSDLLPSPSALPSGTNTLILVNEKRLGDTYGPGAAASTITSLHHLAGDTNYGVNGVVVPVELIAQSQYDAWDNNPCDTDAANSVAQAISAWVDAAKAATPSLKYVVFSGGDDQIPFFRIPDLTRIANESGFASQFARNEYYGALSAGDILSDDPYLDTRPIPADGRQLFVPDLVGGRLVEKPDQIQGAVSRFEAAHGRLDANSAFVSGYDFVSDGSQQVADALARVRSLTPHVLITNDWQKSTLLGDAFPAGGSAAAINDWNGHFDNYRALPADGNASDVITTADVSPLSGGLFFTMGCHAGFQTSDAIVGSSDPGARDWAETLAAQGTQFVGNTGYGLGNTDSVAFSEELMAGFASHLANGTSVGEALAQAKRDYFLARTAFSSYDEKTLAEAEFYGLPMYDVGEEPAPLAANLASNPLPDPVNGTSASVSPSQGGLDPLPNSSANTASFMVRPVFGDPVTGAHGQYFANGGQVQAPNYRPLQPYVSLPASRDGEVAHGVILDALASRDVTPFNPSNVRPTLDLTANEPEPQFTDQAWPSKPVTLVSLQGADSLDQQLNLTTGQFFTSDNGVGVERLWTSMSGRVTYSASPDFNPPTIDSIDAYLTNGIVTFSGHFSDRTETGAAGTVVLAQAVYDVDNSGTWKALPLTLDAATGAWTAAATFSGEHVQYLVEACDGAGNCGWSSNKGRYYDAQAVATPVGTTTLAAAGPQGNGDWYLGSATVTASSSVGATLDVSVDGGPFQPATADGVAVAGDGPHTVDARGSDGSSAELIVLIDSTPPAVNLDLPQTVPQGKEATAVYTCSDTGSTVVSCDGTVPSGGAIDTSTQGTHDFEVRAVDGAGNVTSHDVTYEVGPSNTPPSAAGAPQAAASVTQKTVTLSWAPATDAEQTDLRYTVMGHDGSTGSWSVVSPADTTTTRTFDVHEGTWQFRIETSDGTLSGPPSDSSAPVIVDASAPPVTLTPDRAPEDPTGGWFLDAVNVITSSTGDPRLQDNTPGSGLAAVTGVQAIDQHVTGTYEVTGAASDNAANSTTKSIYVQIDADAPTVSVTCPSGKLHVGQAATASFTAADVGSGLATPASGSVPLDTTVSGRHSATVTARDKVGHVTTGSCDYVVNSPPTAPGTPTATSSPNDGRFVLSWPASTDPDNDPLTYTVKHANASGTYTVVGTTTARSWVFNPESEGTWTYVVSASDGDLSTPSAVSAPVVVDQSNPNAPALKPNRAPDFGTWFKDTVTVTTVSNGDAMLLDGSPGSGVATTTAPQTLTRDGHDSVSGTATDFVGHTATVTQSFDVDSAAPVVSVTCPTAVVLNAVATASWRATDTGSGLATAPAGTMPLDTSHIGTFTSPAAGATDNVGHVGTGTCSYAVIWPFSGFFSPVANLPAQNSAKAGSAVPVKFGLGGDRGLAILAAGYPASQPVSCATDAPLGAVEPAGAPGSSGLQYDASGQYTYVWKTSSAWAVGSCRDLILKLADGTTHRAFFKFK